MNTRKLFASALTVSAILLLTACGGSSGVDTPSTLTKIQTVDEAKTNFQALSSINSIDSAGNELNSKQSANTNNKTTTNNCNYGGTVSISTEGTTTTIIAKQCKSAYSYSLNGSLSIEEFSDGREIVIMSNLTIKDREIEFYSKKLTFVEHEEQHWSTMNGDMNIISKCFTGNYNFETIEKIYEAQDGSDNAQSGILKLNGATYTFANPYVTIKVGDNEETILQSELEKRMEMGTTCSE